MGFWVEGCFCFDRECVVEGVIGMVEVEEEFGLVGGVLVGEGTRVPSEIIY